MTGKPVIQKIKLSNEQKVEIEMIKKGLSLPVTRITKNRMRDYTYEYTTKPKPLSKKQQNDNLVKIFGGKCCVCGSLPDYKVMYDVEGAKRIERYCEKDFNNYKGKIK